MIDPTLAYSTFLGGSDLDQAFAIKVDSLGNVYVAGLTCPSNFPVSPSPQPIFERTQLPVAEGSSCPNSNDQMDAFVTKLNPTGTALVYSTYLGGSGIDFATSLAIDTSGNAYVGGLTYSPNFPTTLGALQTICAPASTYNPALSCLRSVSSACSFGNGVYNGFVTKLNSTGSALVYSTFIGGTGGDFVAGLDVDTAGQVYVTGNATSKTFPHSAICSARSWPRWR